jgi:5-methylthioadenosine/S-adenosylhomocysteine deaminase
MCSGWRVAAGRTRSGSRQFIGSLEVGKKADVVLVDLDTPFAMPVHRVASALVYNVNSGSVDTVIVDGKMLMRGKQVLVVDEKALLAEARAHVRGCLRGRRSQSK